MRADRAVARVAHGGALTAACARFGGAPEDWLDLSTGINTRAVALPVIPASVWQRLPDAQLSDDASRAAAGFYGVSSGVDPLPVAGVQSAIQVLPSVTEGPVAIVGPTYEEYRLCFERAGRPVEMIADLSAVGPVHRLVIVVNPNNPDGRTYRPQDVLDLATKLAARDGVLIVDEAFADLRPDISVAAQAGRQPGLVVLRSFGKFFGLAGLRLGFVLAEAGFSRRMAGLLGPWPVSGPALAVARSVLRDSHLVSSVSEQIAERRKALAVVLQNAGLSIAGGTDLFLLADHGEAQKVHLALCRQHILTRVFDYRCNWIRFGLCPDIGSDQRLGRALAAID